jgi:hypothetical protein
MSTQPKPTRVIVEEHVDSLGDVLPGNTYLTTSRPQHDPLFFAEILVRDFALVELRVGNKLITTKERATVAGSRAYWVEPVAEVSMSQDVSIVLRNDTDRPLRVRQVEFRHG